MSFDLIIRNAKVVTPDGVSDLDIAVENERIAELSPTIRGTATEEIDATNLHVFPGLIDPHVHFNEPGRTHWEGFDTGSSALAAGGGTCFFDMPLNSSPPTLDGPSFDAKRAAAEKNSHTDFALWGGLTPDNLDKLEELAHRGVVGFKAFMCDSGIEDFRRADDWTLEHGMSDAGKLGLPVAVHAENQELIAGKTRWMRSKLPQLTARDWVYTRTPLAEADAIQRALLIASFAKCGVHVVHVSARYNVELAASFKAARDADISIETCPHYLTLTHEDVHELGAIAKCAPPLRVAPHGDQLWERVLDGTVDIIASDHSPSPPEMKLGKEFFDAWGGIAGVQSTLSILLTRRPALPLERIAKLTSTNVADRFNIPNKGRIAPGHDADLALVDIDAQYTLTRDMLLDRHKLSPYVGRTFRGLVKRTIVRGHTVFLDGKITGTFRGRLITPTRGSRQHA